MNILLWVLQVLLAALAVGGGIFQIFKIEELKKTNASMRELPRGLWTFLGAFGCLAGVGLLIPALASIAAAAVAAESVLISALYIYYGDYPPLPFSVAMAVMGAFISYGRFVLKPF